MDAFFLVDLIFTIAKVDGLDWAVCPANLTAYTPLVNVVNLGSLGNAGFVCLGFRSFTCRN